VVVVKFILSCSFGKDSLAMLLKVLELTEKDCLEYCYSKGWHWNENGYELYDLLDRVSCKYCKNKNLKELRNIYHFMPKVWQELKELQDEVQMPYKGGKTIHDIETRFITEDAQISIFDL
jgi:hypothetical protein